MPIPSRTSIDALAAAALASQGRTQMEIASALDLSQSAVSRLLGQAQDYMRVERSFLWNLLEPAIQDEVRRRISNHEIVGRLARLAAEHGHPGPMVHVVPVPAKADQGIRFETFASSAARVLRDLLESARGRVGVAWGSTIWHTAQALRPALKERPFREPIPIEFVPLCGDPLINPQERYADRTSSRIVGDLSRIVHGEESRPAWLGLVPAFIPRAFKKEEVRVIDRLIDLVPQYGYIFGSRSSRSRIKSVPIAGDLNMIITAAGPSNRALGFGHTPLLDLSELETRSLAESIYGDVGGVLLPRCSVTSGKRGQMSDNALVDELTKRWTGLKLEHLRACSARSFSERSPARPGVTLFSFGESHAEVVLEAVRRGLVNHLIIGSDLEDAISA